MILQDIDAKTHIWVGITNDSVRNYGPKEYMHVKGICGIEIEGAKGEAVTLTDIVRDKHYPYWSTPYYVRECLDYGVTPKAIRGFNEQCSLQLTITPVRETAIWQITYVDRGGNILFDFNDKESFKKRAWSGEEILKHHVLLPKWQIVHGDYIVNGIDVRDFTQ